MKTTSLLLFFAFVLGLAGSSRIYAQQFEPVYQNIYLTSQAVSTRSQIVNAHTFEVFPGGDVADIRLSYGRHARLSMGADGSILVKEGGRMRIEPAPQAFQSLPTGELVPVRLKVIIRGNELGLSVQNYEMAQVLTIECTGNHLTAVSGNMAQTTRSAGYRSM
ncbi:MAG: hypothetical protein AAF824_24745 [Bacteroidota bacterium]